MHIRVNLKNVKIKLNWRIQEDFDQKTRANQAQ